MSAFRAVGDIGLLATLAARAATPDTWGAAIDVPADQRVASDLGNRDRMFVPGAAMSTVVAP